MTRAVCAQLGYHDFGNIIIITIDYSVYEIYTIEISNRSVGRVTSEW